MAQLGVLLAKPAVAGLAALIGAGGSVAAAAANKPKPLAPQAAPVRDDVEENASMLEKLRRRKGSGANELLGPGGAEAATPKPTMLGGS